MNSPPRPAVNAGAELSPARLLHSFRRRWLLATSVGLALGAAAACAAYRIVPAPYVARAEIFFKSFSDRLAFETQEPKFDFEIRKQTHQKLVKSRDVLTDALRDPRVSGAAVLRGVENPVEWLAQELVVQAAGPEFFSITLAGDDPKSVALVVNAVADSYIKVVVEPEVEIRLRGLGELEDAAARVAAELLEKRKDLRTITEQTNSSTAAMFDKKQEFLLNMHVELRKQLAQVQLDLIRAEAEQRIRSSGGENATAVPTALSASLLREEPEYQAAERRVEQLRGLADRLAGSLQAGHPKIVDATEKLAAAEAQLAALTERLLPVVQARLAETAGATARADQRQLDGHLAALRAEKEALEKELNSIQIKERDTGVFSLDLDDLTREIARKDLLASSLATEIDRRRFELKTPRPAATIQQRAEVPSTRETRKRLLATGAAGAGVFALVAFGISFLDSRLARISSVGELSGPLDLKLIGVIPTIPRAGLDGPRRRLGRSKSLQWHAALKESVDAARTMVIRQADRDGAKVILVASATSGEGKTTLTYHLAASLARAGRRVVVVDGDLRRPSLSRAFAMDGAAGSCEILRGEASLDEVVRPSHVAGLSVVPAGRLDEPALESLAAGGFGAVFDELRAGFDFVIVDSSPVLPLCDATILSQCADTALFAVRRDVSRLAQVTAAVERLRSVDVPILGAVAIGLRDDSVDYPGLYRSYAGYQGVAPRKGVSADPGGRVLTASGS